jgi:hypothetical protein
MPLQNRVDPFGDIHAVDARGMFTGNRGIIHDPQTKTLLKKRWTTKAWIICTCEYKGVRREPMGRNGPNGNAGWTELFFLDEVTALAAGHRPCFTCRRERANSFAECWGRACGTGRPKAPEMDERLHAERVAPGRPLIALDRKAIDTLPDGAMIFQGERTFAKRGPVLKAWTFWGWADDWNYYDLAGFDIWLLTPSSTVEVLRQGYEPVWHPSARKCLSSNSGSRP